jgi:hypothetical protein
MTLGNMREQGVHHLIAFRLNDASRHQAGSHPASSIALILPGSALIADGPAPPFNKQLLSL